MIEIVKNLYIGNDFNCEDAHQNLLIIHACKTCHTRGVGYRGNLNSSHQNYLILEQGNHLYLNMVDMEREFLPKYTHPIMKSAMLFIEKNIGNKPVLIHCNQGQSRSPSIGLVYLARKGKINSNSYSDARNDFIKVYPEYSPGRGIELYLMNNWEYLMKL